MENDPDKSTALSAAVIEVSDQVNYIRNLYRSIYYRKLSCIYI